MLNLVSRMKRNKIAILVLFVMFLMLLGKNQKIIKHGLDYKLLVQKLPTAAKCDSEITVAQKKTILFWGEFYGGNKTRDYCIEEGGTMDFCKYKCHYTANQDDFDSSDAIVIHGRESNEMKLPLYRREKQRFVFLMFESPVHSFVNISQWKDFINWTMTYRSDSDVPIPYGRIIPRPSNEITRTEEFYLPTFEDFRMKKFAAWAVSNCYLDSSHRNKLVNRMDNFITIDRYGRCGEELYRTCVQTQQRTTDQCTIPAECHEYLGTRYKFYLAFENSLCKEYITEKFFNALRFGMIPVVYGPDRKYYEAIAPPDSFIHVHDFSSVKELTQHLLRVGSSFSEYIKYFKWRKSYVIDEIGVFHSAWCRLCEKLHTLGDSPPKSYKSLRNWWFNNSSGNVTNICSTVRLNSFGVFD